MLKSWSHRSHERQVWSIEQKVQSPQLRWAAHSGGASVVVVVRSVVVDVTSVVVEVTSVVVEVASVVVEVTSVVVEVGSIVVVLVFGSM